MRISLLTLFIVLVSLFSLTAQKTDYIWLTGYGAIVPDYDSTCQCGFGITEFNFNQLPVLLSYDSLGINFGQANSIISDSSGNLCFYSNGSQIWNRSDEIMQNGDSLGWGPLFTYLDPAAHDEGLPFFEQAVILQSPLANNIYDMFYIYIDSIPNSDIPVPNKLLRTRIDMSANGGLGAVIEKDVPVLEEDNDFTISAVRHGNGRDWWLCTNRVPTNCHTMLLYNGSDSMTITEQCSGVVSPFTDVHACRFSPDGNYYITTNDSGQVDVFNFDRCNGKLNLLEQFVVPEIADSFQWFSSGLEFSPDSRFFYLMCSYRVFQYDLTATPIVSSRETIATYGYPGHYPSDYYWGQLAPDGKIYINSGFGTYYISVIDSPGNKGSACHFLDQSLNIHNYTAGLPYYPNYRLGALTQSQCDSLSSATQDARDAKERILKVFPNPAGNMVTVDYGFTDWTKGQPILSISNGLGQVVYEHTLPMYSGFQQIDVSRFETGVYQVFIKRENGVVATSKLIVIK